jgi:hypothetical protein
MCYVPVYVEDETTIPVRRFKSTAALTTFIVAVKDLPDRSTAATQLAVRQAPVRISTMAPL